MLIQHPATIFKRYEWMERINCHELSAMIGLLFNVCRIPGFSPIKWEFPGTVRRPIPEIKDQPVDRQIVEITWIYNACNHQQIPSLYKLEKIKQK